MVLFKQSDSLAKFFVHYLFFVTSNTFYGQVLIIFHPSGQTYVWVLKTTI